jgi:hypothetical protein
MPTNPLCARIARPLSCHKAAAWAAFAALLLSAALSPGAQKQDVDQTYQARIPMGAEALRLGKSGKVLYLLAMADAEQFEGWRHVRTHGESTLTDASGASVQSYPATIRFRVTVSTRKDLLDIPAYPHSEPPDLDKFLLSLRFQVKMFRGLKQTVIKPDSVQQVGVPEGVAYDERVYELTFSFQNLPITDRCLLEVYSPNGERVARFHLEPF